MNIGPSIWGSAILGGAAGSGGGGAGGWRSEAEFVVYNESTFENVYRMGISSTTFTLLISQAGTNDSQPRGMDADEINRKLYICLSSDDEIIRCDLDGSNEEVFASVTAPYDCCIDAENGILYVCSNTGQWIKSFTVGGATETDIVAAYGNPVIAITQDGPAGDLFARIHIADEIHKVTLAGVTTHIGDYDDEGFGGLALDYNASPKQLYYSNLNAGIKRMDLDGSNVTTVVSDPDSEGLNIRPPWIDVDDTKIYVGDFGANAIAIYDKETGDRISLTSVPQNPVRALCAVYTQPAG